MTYVILILALATTGVVLCAIGVQVLHTHYSRQRTLEYQILRLLKQEPSTEADVQTLLKLERSPRPALLSLLKQNLVFVVHEERDGKERSRYFLKVRLE